MDFDSPCDVELVHRLPLPLAQLYRRALNAVSASNRLNTSYCLWEAALKLLGSVAIVAYSDRGEYSPELTERLKNLSRPALGHWWEFVRLLLPKLADAGEPGFGVVRDLLFGRARDDMPRAAGLDSALRDVLEGHAGARSTVRLGELFDRMVRFRNREIGHGPLGQQPAEFQDRMGAPLLGGVVEILGRLDVMAGRRLVYVADVRREPAGNWVVERFQMVGEASRRLRPLEVPAADAIHLPHTDRVYLEPEQDEHEVTLRSLHPLVLCNHEMAEVFFLNARRGLKRAEYLCYHPGRVEERADLGVEQRAFLARVLGMPVDSGQIDSWAARSAAEDPPVPAIAAVPSRRLGEFELLTELGRGGMGVVYRAWQPSLGRQVALKRLLNAGDAKAESRFAREIHALGRVDHPNLVKTYTSGSDGEHWFYAMELVEGATLAAVCDTLRESCEGASHVDLDTWRASLSSACEQARQAERPIVAAEPGDVPLAAEPRQSWALNCPQSARSYARHVAELIRQVAGTAQALHEAGIVHRDIKPGNIMVTADGRQAILMDLGLAQLADDVHGKLTRTRQFVGTLRYASPEQVLAVGGVDHRSDIYSLGASLWELLTLRPMFGATEETPTPDLMQRIQYEEPEPVRRYNVGITRNLEAIVHKCLAKDPRRRYGSSAELADDLRRFLDDESVLARREHPAQRLWRKAMRRPLATSFGFLAIAAVAALAVALPKMITAQRSADIAARLDDLIERGDASGLNLGAIDSLIAQLTWIAPQQAAIRRKEVAARIAQQIDDDIRTKSTLEPEDEARLNAEISRFASRDSRRAKELAQHLAVRVRSWHEVARLTPPFEGLDTVFDASRVIVEGSGLGPKAPDSAAGPVDPHSTIYLPTRVACLGNVQLDVTFGAGSWNTGERIGLLLHDNQWHTGPIRGLAYDETGKTLVILDEQGVTRLWNIQAHSPTTLPAPPRGSISLAFGLPNGKDAETAGAATPELRDVALGESLPGDRSARLGQAVAAVAPAGRAVAMAGTGGRVMLFATRRGSLERVGEFQLSGRDVLCLALSEDGKMIAAGARDGSISLLVPASEKPLAVLNGHVGEVTALVFKPNGGLLASGGADTKVHLWDVAKATRKSLLNGHQGKVTALTFSLDGRMLASGSLDNTVRIWNLATEQSDPPFKVRSAPIYGLAFSPDHRTVAVGYGRCVKLWDTLASHQIEELRPQHYALEVRATREGRSDTMRGTSSPTVTLGDAIAASRPLNIQLARDGQLLRERDVPVQADGTLTLSAKLEGGRLQLQVNGALVAFHDPFSMGRAARGVFGLDLSSRARIEHLLAMRLRPSEQPSWIERGDEFFAEGEPAKALDAYRNQDENSANAQVVQEAKCKEGVCLAAVGRTNDAIRIFEQVEAEPGDRWPTIAGCRLWLLHLQQKNIDKAFAVYSRLSSKGRLERIASLVPADIPAEIVNAYAPVNPFSPFIDNPNRIRDLELARVIAKETQVPFDQQTRITCLLAQAYQESGLLDRADATYTEMLSGPPLSLSDESSAVQNQVWVLDRLKKYQVALYQVDNRLTAGREANHLLFVTRAQFHARRADWVAARADIDEFFRRQRPNVDSMLYEACLTRGFIREALGDRNGAQESWRQGYRAASGTRDMANLLVAIQASLSGDLTPDDARIMFNTVADGLHVNMPYMTVVESLRFSFDDITSGLRTMWSTARGREYARKIAFHDITFSESVKAQVYLTVSEICRYSAFGGTLTQDDDELLWMMVQSLFRDYTDRKLNDGIMIQLTMTWLGFLNPLTWPAAARVVPRETRGRLAYVLGWRYQQIGKLADARSFFESAIKDSEAGTTLERRSRSALDRLNAPK